MSVESQRRDPRSLLTLYRRLLEARRAHPALALGTYEAVPAPGDLLAYLRRSSEEELLVVLNMGPRAELAALPEGWSSAVVLLSSGLDRDGERMLQVAVRPHEGLVVRHLV